MEKEECIELKKLGHHTLEYLVTSRFKGKEVHTYMCGGCGEKVSIKGEKGKKPRSFIKQK